MRRAPVVVLLAALLLAVPSSAQALDLRPCAEQEGFGCGVLRVPLARDAGGAAIPGTRTLRLRVAAEDSRSARRKKGLLIALTGGPGQGGIFAASSFAVTLKPLLRDRRLVVLDQRGTGDSGVLRCPALQRTSDLAPFTPEALLTCAEDLGPQRAHFATRDTVDDLEALRRAFGARKVALMGVSYGTFVSQQYARTHPRRTELLVLDSVVSGDGVDPFLLDTYRRVPRILREQCAKRACRDVTRDPVADVREVLEDLRAGELRGRVPDTAGALRPVAYTAADELAFLLTAGDLNPALQAVLPGAVAQARAGDRAALLRLKAIGEGADTATKELSVGLNVATSCVDVALPYGLGVPAGARREAAERALDAIDPAQYAPFDRDAIFTTSYVDDCLLWPADGARAPSRAPLPDVPAILLGGRLDLRTPIENARELRAELPRAQELYVPGTGHDVLDTDGTGCAATAMRRFAAGRKVGSPCTGKTNAYGVVRPSPRKLADVTPIRGIPGDRSRVAAAALDAVGDAQIILFARYFAGLPERSGGLRGGSVLADDDGLRLRAYATTDGVRVTGRLRVARSGELVGRLRVQGPGRLDGTLALRRNLDVVARVGGRTLSISLGDASASAASGPRAGALLRDARRLAVLARDARPPLAARR